MPSIQPKKPDLFVTMPDGERFGFYYINTLTPDQMLFVQSMRDDLERREGESEQEHAFRFVERIFANGRASEAMRMALYGPHEKVQWGSAPFSIVRNVLARVMQTVAASAPDDLGIEPARKPRRSTKRK